MLHIIIKGLMFVSGLFIGGSLLAGEKLVFMQELNDVKRLLVKDLVTGSIENLETHMKVSLYPSIAPDGSKVYFVGGEDLNQLAIYEKNRKTGIVTKISQKSGLVLHPSLSKQGNKLSYSFYSEDVGRQLFAVVNLNTLKEEVYDLGGSVYFPRISSSGDFIIFQKNEAEGLRKIYKYDLQDGEGQPEVLTADYDNCMAPQVSFDDSQIVFTCLVNEKWNIFLKSLSHDKIEALTNTTYRDFAPLIDSKGNLIFASDRSGRFQLYIKEKAKNLSFVETSAKELHLGQGDFYAPSVSGETKWSQGQIAPFPEPRSSFATVDDGQNIYVIGGHQGPEHTYPEESFTDLVHRYNILNEVWESLAPRPVKAHGYGAAFCQGHIFAFGGFAYSHVDKPHWKSINQIDKYDPLLNKWTTLQVKMPRKRSSNVVLKFENKIYLFGGWDSTPKFDGDYDGQFHKEVDVFDCDSEKFIESHIELPAPLRRAFTGVAEGDRLYLLGGISEGASHFNLLDNVTEFNPISGEFNELPPLPAPSFAPAAGFIEDNLFLMGGMLRVSEFNYTYVNHIFYLGLSQTLGWKNSGRFLSEAKGFSQVLKIKGRLYILGGHTYDGGEDRPSNKVELLF